MKIKDLLLLMLMFFLFSCSSNDNLEEPKPTKLTVIIPSFGLGDMGYDDLIMTGIMKFYEKHSDIGLSLHRTFLATESLDIIQKWLDDDNGNAPSMLLLASSDFEQVVHSMDIHLKDNQQILLIESASTNLPKGVTTFHLKRYGVSYLAGCMAHEHASATIIAAMPGNGLLNESIDGFSEAYSKYSGQSPGIYYLADYSIGFDMPDAAYKIMTSLNDTFIFPIAGGSNNGIYKYLREYEFHSALVAGMDVDCSVFSPRVPFSIVYKIDELLQLYLNDWFNDKPLPQNAAYGLDSKWVDIAINDRFMDEIDIWPDYCIDDNYWTDSYNKYKQEAIEIEQQHETPSN